MNSDSGGVMGYVSVSGVASLGMAAWLLLLGRSSDREAAQLLAAHALEKLNDARKLEQALPTLVAMRGRVACQNPRACELCDSKAAIYEVVEEDILASKHANGSTSRTPFETRREVTEREWCVDDGSGATIRVEGGRSASRLESCLELKQEYKERQEGALQSTLTWAAAALLTGQKHTGHRKTERFLPVGAIVTVIGELAASRLGGARLSVRRPADPAGPFYITHKTLTQLHAEVAANARTYRVFAWCFGTLGAVLVVRKALSQWLRRRRQWKARQRALLAMLAAAERDAAAAGTGGRGSGVQAPVGAEGAQGGSGGAAAEDRPSDLCVVCLEQDSNMVFVNCGHMCACIGCSVKLRRCPVCRTRGDAIRVFRT